MRKRNKLQMQSRLLVYNDGTNFPTFFLGNVVSAQMKKRDTSLVPVPRICLDFLIFRKATSNKKRELKAIQFPFLLGVFQ